MTPDQLALARALIASPHWRWMDGMRLTWEHAPLRFGAWDWAPRVARLVDSDSGWLPLRGVRAVDDIPSDPLPETLPDLTDPATVGCIAHLARAAWRNPGLTIEYRDVVDPRRWICGNLPGYAWTQSAHLTEGEAWAATMLLAPEAP